LNYFGIPNINPNYGYIRLWGDFNDSRIRSKNDIVEYVIAFENGFDVVQGNTCVSPFIDI